MVVKGDRSASRSTTIAVSREVLLWLKALALRRERDTGKRFSLDDVIREMLRNRPDDENSEPLLFTSGPDDIEMAGS